MSLEARRRRSRRLSLTSLIDVIFLLLLFFMLSSTFSRFAEVELSAGGAAAAAAPDDDRQVFFLRLAADRVTLNGEPVELAALGTAVAERREDGPAAMLVAVAPGVTAQRLTDALAATRGLDDLPVTVLEGS